MTKKVEFFVNQNGCHVVTSHCLNDKGYPLKRINGKNERLHRIYYEKNKGAIPLGYFVLHKCDNPSCINPEHLFVGTNADNVRDMINKKRNSLPPHYYGEKHPLHKLTKEKVDQIRSSNSTATFFSKLFGVSITTISNVRKNKVWANQA